MSIFEVRTNEEINTNSSASGSPPAPWILSGHRYVFILQDANGTEIAHDENDLRQPRGSGRRG
jgi:hypothetical protein